MKKLKKVHALLKQAIKTLEEDSPLEKISQVEYALGEKLFKAIAACNNAIVGIGLMRSCPVCEEKREDKRKEKKRKEEEIEKEMGEKEKRDQEDIEEEIAKTFIKI